MLIDPTELYQGLHFYTYNDIVEREIGRILSHVSGLPVSRFSENVARPEYDFYLGDLPVELKITNGVYLPVEVAKDEAATIPSGVAASIAPFILYISHGHGNKAGGSAPVAKVRMLERKRILRECRNSPPSFYPGKTENEGALVYYLKGPFFTNDMWLGDMEFRQDEKQEKWLYDTSTFVPSRRAAGFLQSINSAYIAGDIS